MVLYTVGDGRHTPYNTDKTISRDFLPFYPYAFTKLLYIFRMT